MRNVFALICLSEIVKLDGTRFDMQIPLWERNRDAAFCEAFLLLFKQVALGDQSKPHFQQDNAPPVYHAQRQFNNSHA